MCEHCRDKSLDGMDMLHILGDIAMSMRRTAEKLDLIIEKEKEIIRYEKDRKGKI